MSTVGSVQVDEGRDSVTIESLTIEDAELADFLSEYDPENHPEIIGEALTIGMKTMQLMDTSQDVEYVERRLGELEDELKNEVTTFQEELDEKFGKEGELQEALDEHVGENGTLQSRIEAAFDEDGPFVERLDDELGEDGDRIQSALDPDEEGTPIYRLEKRLKDEIEGIHEKIVEMAAKEEVRSKTYLKGGDFEDTVGSVLEEIVRQTPNNVEATGEEKGEMDREVGDFVVDLAETGQTIVVEAKTENYSTHDIKEEMTEELRNRDAAYGIFVTDTLENLPQTKTGWFHEYPEQNTVVVAMSETDEEDLEPGYLRMAFNWARMRAIQSYAEVGDDFDPEKVQAELRDVKEDIKRFETIRGQCTEIKKSSRKIEETLDEIESDVKEKLASMESELIASAT